MIFAHIGGLPVEETLLQLAPAAGAVAILVRARLRAMGVWRRRRVRRARVRA